MHRVITMRDRVDDSLEHGGHVVLWLINAPHLLPCAYRLVSRDEHARTGDLLIDWSSDVLCIDLIPWRVEGARHVPPSVRYRLNVSMRQPSLRPISPHENTGNGGVPFVVSRPLEHPQLPRKCLQIIPVRLDTETLDTGWIQFGEQRTVNGLLVETNQS